MITAPTRKLFNSLRKIQKKEKDNIKDSEKIKLNKMIGKLAFVYEKVRNTLDYKDEHLFRKDAIQRILKRRLVLQVKGSDVAKLLVNELIRARYLDDNVVLESKVFEVTQILNKYILLRNEVLDRYQPKVVEEIYDWTLSMMACEIEESLVSNKKINAYIENFYQTVVKRIKLKDEKFISRKDLDLQIYIAIIRALTKSDRAMISYRLFKMYYPTWTSPTKKFVLTTAKDAKKIKDNIDLQINHSIGKHISRKIRPYSVYYQILEDLYEEKGDEIEELVTDRELLDSEVKKVCNGIYKKVKKKLGTSVFRSIIYIFFTKIFLAVILEMPFDLYFFGHIEYLNLGINITFPPLLLFLITMSARAPSDKNTEKIVQGIGEIVYGENKDTMIFEVKRSYDRSKILQTLFKFLYFITFIVSYGIIIVLLKRMGFNLLNGGLFLLFLSLVSYFGIRVRTTAKELVVLPRKENILTFLLDLFSFPIIRVGQWISLKSSKINVFVFILDFIIEAPFKSLIELIEEWFKFFKEKKDEIS